MVASAGPLPEGFVLDAKYRIERVLGSSGMGIVYLAEHLALERRVAIKFLLASAMENEDGLARFRREAKVLARLQSPHVVRVFDVGTLDDVGPYIVMEYLEGEDLAHVLKREGRLSVARACSLAIQAAEGLAAAHLERIIHRDVKPANLFIVRDDDGAELVKVIDFGIAKLARATEDENPLTRSAAFLGSPRFMSPEQIYGDKAIDVQTDVWSLAIVLFEALTGASVFHADTVPKLLMAIAIGEVPSLASCTSDAPGELVAVLAAALRKDVATRTPDMLTFGRALAPFASASESSKLTLRAQDEVLASDAPTRTSANGPRHNLAAEANAFIGRRADLAALAEAIESGARLVTLLGIGGTGKTRLATHFARESVDSWPGGAWFCDLSDANTLDAVTFSVAGALNVPLGREDAIVQLGHAIAGRGRCLLILDNFEQVAREAHATVGKWLERAPEACFIVTSREVLRLDAERALPLDPLESDEAVALFEARAKAANPSFSLNDANRPVVRDLVALLDRLPLAIELAAARARLMTPASMLERMTQRFKLLAGSGAKRTRQATLRGALDWSWDLLSKDERTALEQVSVFEGGFTLEAAEAVLSLEALWAIDAVQSLVDKSLVRRVSDERFGLLVSVHEYAKEKLDASGQRSATERRHGAYYARFGTEEAIDSLDSHGGVEKRAALALDIDNLARASTRAVKRGAIETMANAALAAWAVLEFDGPYPWAVTLLASVRDTTNDPTIVRGKLCEALGNAHRLCGRIDVADGLFAEALALYERLGHRRGEASALDKLARIDFERGRVAHARERLEAALAIWAEVGERRWAASSLAALGVLLRHDGLLDEAKPLLDSALAVHREAGNVAQEGIVIIYLANLALVRNELDEARTSFEAALRICRQVGNRRFEGVALIGLADIESRKENHERALASLERSLAIQRQIGNPRGEGVCLGEIGTNHFALGRVEEARRAMVAAIAILSSVQDHDRHCLLLATRAACEAGHAPEQAKRDLAEAEAIAERFGWGANAEVGQRIEKARFALRGA